MLLDPLTNFEIQNHCQNQSNFNGAYSRNNLPKTKDAPYVINLDELRINRNSLDSFICEW